MKKVVLAYSGGLDTSVAVRVAGRAGLGRRRGCGRRRAAGRSERGGRAGDHARRRRRSTRRCARPLRRGLRTSRSTHERPLPRALPTRVGSLATSDLGGARRRRRKRRERTRLRTGAPGRATTRSVSKCRSAHSLRSLQVLAPVRDWGMTREETIRYADGARPAGQDDQGVSLFDRREPVGSQHRVRRPGGPVGLSARRHLRVDVVPCRCAPFAAGDRDRIR